MSYAQTEAAHPTLTHPQENLLCDSQMSYDATLLLCSQLIMESQVPYTKRKPCLLFHCYSFDSPWFTVAVLEQPEGPRTGSYQ